MLRRALGILALVLPLAGPVGVRSARAAPNYLIVVYDASWVSALEPLVDLRESLDWDREESRAWEVEVRTLASIRQEFGGADSTAIRSYVAARRAACPGDLFVMLAGDANDPYEPGGEELNHIPMRYIYDPELSFWSDYVSTDDIYADVTGDDNLDVCVFRLPAHSVTDVSAYVTKVVYLFYNQDWASRDHPPDARREEELRPRAGSSAELTALYQSWAAHADSLDAAARGERAELTSALYLHYVDVVCEDANINGHSGQLVEDHGRAVQALWPSSGNWEATYYGDETPGDYYAREALADGLDNRGHQLKIDMGTVASTFNMVNFQDMRFPYYWDPATHLADNLAFPLHIAASCHLGDIDSDISAPPARPFAEATLFLPYKGSFAVVAPTRGGPQYGHYWLASELSSRLAADVVPDGTGMCVGRALRQTKNALLAAYPEHASLWHSFIGLGDPTARVVASPGIATEVAGPPAREEPGITARPNPSGCGVLFTVKLPIASAMNLRIYDATGRLVRVLASGRRPVGASTVYWDGRDSRGRRVAAGIYFARLRSTGVSETTRVVLVGE